MTRCLMPLAAIIAVSTSLHATEPISLDQIRHAVDGDGRVTDAQLRRQTGWEVLRGFSWRIELEDSERRGWFQPADAARVFRHGQRFRVHVEAFCDLFVYILVKNADGSTVVLLPEPGEKAPRVAKGAKVVLPDDGTAFRFEPPAGTEGLRIVGSPVELPWIDGGELFKIENGQELSRQEEDTLAQLKSVRRQVKGLGNAVRAITAGELAKGCEVVLTESSPEGNLVTLTSTSPDANPIIVCDVALRHDD
ncbi:MAG: DUF4384 domain-containing protein [Rhodopirellula sp.]|nr:DUF4384 domain-containing protein [Rhodopirellula sp.]